MTRLRLRFAICLAGALAATLGCKQGPDYARPEVPTPEAFRGLEQSSPLDGEATSFGDLEWIEMFGDPVLQELVRTALQENYDVRIAAERVLEARAFVTITRADLYPDLRAGAAFERTRVTENGAVEIPAGVDKEQDQWSLLGDLSWELDFWGRYRRATEAARADLAATEFARRAVIQTLVSELALAYFELLELDAELVITHRTIESRERSHELVTYRLEEGVANKVEFYQSHSLVLESAGLVPVLENRIEQQENLIRLLTGANPGAVPRGDSLLEQDLAFEIPIGLPSELLERRPDVRRAEEGLVAATAQIGVARALLFPSISLTAFGGFASESLSDLIDGDSKTWTIKPSATVPIFNAGRLRSNVEATEARQRQAVLEYLQTLQNAFRETSDALVARTKTAEVRSWAEQLEATLTSQVELSRDRYRGGVTSYLEVLDSERGHFDSQLALVRVIRDELFAHVRLYRALGGGWQGAEELAATGPQGVVSEPEAGADAGLPESEGK